MPIIAQVIGLIVHNSYFIVYLPPMSNGLYLSLYYLVLVYGVCEPNPCKNGGKCANSTNDVGYECSCVIGWLGVNCEIGKI